MAAEPDRPGGRPMLLIGAIVAAVVLVAGSVVAAVLALPLLVGRSSLGAPSPPAAASATTGASPVGGEQSVAAPAVVDASSFEWASALVLPPPAGRPLPVSFSLQGGTLAEPGPTLDLVVPFPMTGGLDDAGRLPAIAEPVNGAVVYAADDGRRTELRRAALSGAGDELMAELEAVVWSIVVTPDGDHAYVLLRPRVGPGDAGVARVALDGSGQVERVMPPSVAGGEAAPFRLAAIAGFRASLMLSPDASVLLRRVCSGPEQECAVDVLHLDSGQVSSLTTPDVIGVSNGLVFTNVCDAAGCHVATVDVATGGERPVGSINGTLTLVEVDGRPVLVHTSPPRGEPATVLQATDPATGETIELLRGAPGGSVELHSNLHASLKISGPAGWVIATVWRQGGGADAAAVNVADGTTIPLPRPPADLPSMPQVQD